MATDYSLCSVLSRGAWFRSPPVDNPYWRAAWLYSRLLSYPDADAGLTIRRMREEHDHCVSKIGSDTLRRYYPQLDPRIITELCEPFKENGYAPKSW